MQTNFLKFVVHVTEGTDLPDYLANRADQKNEAPRGVVDLQHAENPQTLSRDQLRKILFPPTVCGSRSYVESLDADNFDVLKFVVHVTEGADFPDYLANRADIVVHIFTQLLQLPAQSLILTCMSHEGSIRDMHVA